VAITPPRLLTICIGCPFQSVMVFNEVIPAEMKISSCVFTLYYIFESAKVVLVDLRVILKTVNGRFHGQSQLVK
jgi:hypothetical protein